MNPWDLACLVRFQAFPFTEDVLKRRPIRYILEMDVGNPEFQKTIKPCLELNQFTRFCKLLSHIRHNKWVHMPLHVEQDAELVEVLFWNETDEALAKRILATLLRFPTHLHPTVWQSGMNLLLGANSREDKVCVLTMMAAFSG
jgi:hypothetical protein